jgi:putative sugar O-methyltransferase
MTECLSQGNPVYLPSKFWEELNNKNIKQLESDGIDNIKQTVAQNYFTWVNDKRDQFRYLLYHTRLRDWPSILKKASIYDPSSTLGRKQQIELGIFTRMLWKFAERSDEEGLLRNIAEPTEGNPYKIYFNDKLISQDIANSALEYYSMREHFKVHASAKITICELGAGYGRNAYLFINAFPNCKYIVIDIPPALYISQQYLKSVFHDKKIFTFRCFDDFKAVENEFLESDIVFLLPHQAEMIPSKCTDLFVNISSLHEMKPAQIGAYFKLIDKVTKGYFYTKQWFVSHNAADGLIITPADYPVPATWEQLYFRKVKVQMRFFEAMYKLDR